MSAFEKDSRIVPPFKPSLSYMCTAKIAVALYNEFGHTPLKDAFPELKLSGLRESKKCSPEQRALLRNKAKERLLLIPTILRKDIFEALERVVYEIRNWLEIHERRAGECYENCTFFWRSDGTIDRSKTAQEIACNENVDVASRFKIACMYCLEKSVQTLWAVLEANGEAQCYDMPHHECYVDAMICFWVKWLREGAQFHWTSTFMKHVAVNQHLYFRMHIVYGCNSEPSLSSLFRALMPEDRSKFFEDLCHINDEEIRSCLYTVTNVEQDEIMKLCAAEVLRAHTIWPFSSLFLEIAEKSWKYLDLSSFHRMMDLLLCLRDHRDYDYYEYLVMEFWNRCPEGLKEQGANSTFWISPRVMKFIKETGS